jgi:hypothetical protein
MPFEGSEVQIRHCHTSLHWLKFMGDDNRGDQKVNFGLQNVLNLTNAHLQFKKFSRGLYTGPPLKRGGEGGWARK